MPSATDAFLCSLTGAILTSLSEPHQDYREHVQKLFGTRYQARYAKDCQVRDAYALGTVEDGDGVPYAGIINPDNPIRSLRRH
jgi:hypothetical protein